jgi:Cu2+-exporting ATPase
LNVEGSWVVEAVAELTPCDRVLVRTGETVPADGCILERCCSTDESQLTGESMPLARTMDDPLVGGSVNMESPVVMRVEKVGAETVLSSIVRLLDRAQSEKPPLAQMADRVAAWIVGGILLVAASVAWWWWNQDPGLALPITLSVLVVTCPCALSLATPAAITAATSSLTRLGLLTTRGHALETLARATHIVLDKTGTLTYGRPRLLAVKSLRERDERQCLAIAAALERGSEHPLARALIDATDRIPPASNVHNTPGQGVEGYVDGVRYRVGKPEFVASLSNTSLSDLEKPGPTATWVALGDEQNVLALLQLADKLRPDALQTINNLRAMGLQVVLLSGDCPETVNHIARQVSIQHSAGGLLPEDKLNRIRALQAQGAVVAMEGDGINDAPVLAASRPDTVRAAATAPHATTVSQK